MSVGTCSNDVESSSLSSSLSMIMKHMMAILQIILNHTTTATGTVISSTHITTLLYISIILAILCTFLLLKMIWNELHISYHLLLWYEYFFIPIPLITIPNLPISVTEDDYTTDDTTDTSAKHTTNGDTKVQHQRPSLIDPKRPNMIQCYDPSTDQYLGEVPVMTSQEVHDACMKASIAQKEWSKTTYQQRRIVLRTIQKYIVYHSYTICRVSARDSGKPIIDGYLGEILTTTEKIRTIIEMGELWLLPSYRTTGIMFCYKVPRVEYIPYGIIAPIAPWNYPFHNFMNHIISGIFAGNAVVGKVSEYTSWSAVVYYSHIVKIALQIHGHNPDLVQTITGFGPTGEALVTDPLIDKIIFTGSPAIGKKVMMSASQNLKPVILELGGKDAMVITNDCTISNVIPWILRGCYQNGGQNCVGVERVFVYESIHDELIKAIVPKVQALRQGIPLRTNTYCSDGDVDCGALVMETQIQHIQVLIDDAIQHGAKVIVGGKRNTNIKYGQFYEPTIIINVTNQMRIYHEEVFGPVMTIIKVPNDNDTTCINMINDSNFGLSSSVYCNNATRAYNIGKQLHTGMCCINDFGSNYLIQSLPFGGVKDSGFGRFAGIEGLRALCIERSIVTDRFPNFIQTSIPKSIDYPIDPKRGIPFVQSLIQLFYGEYWIDKIKAIVGLIKNG